MEKNRVAKPNTKANAPAISKNIERFQLTSGGNRLKGNGKVKSANQLVPWCFSRPASPNSQANINLNASCGSHVLIAFNGLQMDW